MPDVSLLHDIHQILRDGSETQRDTLEKPSEDRPDPTKQIIYPLLKSQTPSSDSK